MTAHLEFVRARPPAMLRPRVLADDVHVVAVKAVEEVVYLTAEQTIVATLLDEADHPFTVTVAHRAVAPHAVDAAAAALRGPVRFVAGELRRGRFGMALDVTAIAGETVVVPDLATAPTAGGEQSLPRHDLRTRPDVLGDALRTAFAALEETVHVGVKSLDEHALRRLQGAAAQLEAVGLRALARELGDAHAKAKAGDAPGAARAVLRGAVRASITQDAR